MNFNTLSCLNEDLSKEINPFDNFYEQGKILKNKYTEEFK